MGINVPSRKRVNALAAILVTIVVANSAARYPALFGWPGAYILSAWTPGPIRAIALRKLEERASAADLPLIKKMLRSDDPRLRRRGIALIDRFRSMDEFFELERLTRDPDPDVRATAHAYLPVPNDESLAVTGLLPGLKDDSDMVFAIAAQRLALLRASEALPDLVAYLQAKRKTGTLTGADMAVGNAAARVAGIKVKFDGEPEPLICGTALAIEVRYVDRPFPRMLRAGRSFVRSLRGDWDDGLEIKPAPFKPVAQEHMADNFAALDQLLSWWDAHGKRIKFSRLSRSRRTPEFQRPI